MTILHASMLEWGDFQNEGMMPDLYFTSNFTQEEVIAHFRQSVKDQCGFYEEDGEWVCPVEGRDFTIVISTIDVLTK